MYHSDCQYTSTSDSGNLSLPYPWDCPLCASCIEAKIDEFRASYALIKASFDQYQKFWRSRALLKDANNNQLKHAGERITVNMLYGRFADQLLEKKINWFLVEVNELGFEEEREDLVVRERALLRAVEKEKSFWEEAIDGMVSEDSELAGYEDEEREEKDFHSLEGHGIEGNEADV
ncbi:MAG: hypothetical protein M1812_004356 [Candelaria pacifica]|nr:MAG: hypothetical protein M1812_004356 [Candelaria pacifica]